MVQVAKNRYTSDRYHDMIGFEVSKPLLERAFLETYGLKLEDVFGSVDLAIGSYRRSVSTLIPEMTRVALLSRHDVIVKETPNFNKKKFLYHLSRSNYEHEWGTVLSQTRHRKPDPGILSEVDPEGGPVQSRQLQDSHTANRGHVHQECERHGRELHRLCTTREAGKLDLPNRDCDTGRETRAGEYALTDKAYAQLIDKLSGKSSDPPSPALRDDLLHFYSDLNAPNAAKKDPKGLAEAAGSVERPEASARPAAGKTACSESVNRA